VKLEPTLNALADPTRLRIMRLLEHLELAVGELAQALGQSQPRVSRHAAILCDSGLAERRREGSWVFLRKAISRDSTDPLAVAVAHLLHAAEKQDAQFAAQCEVDRQRLNTVRAARESSAAQFFAGKAEKWDQLRALLSPAEEVENLVLDQLGDAHLGRLLDIGTGTGRMAQLLADRCDHVVGFDRSTEMLRLARARLQDLPAERWELVQGDFNALPFAEETFDTVVLHQVLHYAQDPGHVVKEAAQSARPDARVVIVDLAEHHNEELRDSHAHVRLGFSQEQMQALMEGAGLSGLPPAKLSGKGLPIYVWIARKIAP